MPELPEVETIARALQAGGRGGPPLAGRAIHDVQVFWPRTVQTPGVEELRRRIAGQTIARIGRRGKFVVAQLAQDTLLVHLRMSGDLRVEPHRDESGEARPVGAYDRVLFLLDDDLRLVFEDTRKFGRIWLLSDSAEVLGGLGPEPFDPALTTEVFHRLLRARKRQIKALLLDQGFLAGLGNIYTDEALHLAGIHPLYDSSRLSLEQAGRLLEAIHTVLQKGIAHSGASIDWVYRGGDFQNHFAVYQRTGEACSRCGQAIEKITVGQRGTHFCPVCQPRD